MRPSQDLTIAGLKIQNCIMDEGLDLCRAHEPENRNCCNGRPTAKECQGRPYHCHGSDDDHNNPGALADLVSTEEPKPKGPARTRPRLRAPG